MITKEDIIELGFKPMAFVDFKESDNSYDKSYTVSENKFDEGLEYYIELYVDNQLTEDKQYIIITKKYKNYESKSAVYVPNKEYALDINNYYWRVDKSSFRGYVNIDEFKTILNLLNIK